MDHIRSASLSSESFNSSLNTSEPGVLRSEFKDLTECSSQVFMGDFADATYDLLMNDSSVKRATAARQLGILGRPLASPYLVAALSDNAPEVRQAVAESLGHIGGAEAIAPLEDLLAHAEEELLRQTISKTLQAIAGRLHKTSAIEPVIANPLYHDSHEMIEGVEDSFLLPDQEELLRREELALREATEDLERRRSESEQRRQAEDEKQRVAAIEANRLRADTETQQRIERESRVAAEIEALHKAEADQLKRIQEASAEDRRSR